MKTKLSLAAAAMAGLLAGASSRTMAAPVSQSSSASSLVAAKSIAGLDARLGVKTVADDGDKHDCATKNSCAKKGGCKSGDQGCKGKNTCKGKGGCATNKVSVAANNNLGAKAIQLADDSDKHDCATKNSCAKKGGCKSGDQGCKGKNTCKGKGGCATNKVA